MKVLLVAVNSKYIHSNLAVRYLKAFTENLDFQCEIKEFSINDKKERILEDIIMNTPDLVAFSCYIWNVEYVRDISKLIKLVNPSIEILLGGPEVSYDCREILEKEEWIDYIIQGEGEESFKEFIEAKFKKEDFSSVLGVYYKNDNKVCFSGPRPLIDMNKIVFPYKEYEDLNDKVVYYEASRGCPFKCKYCLSSTLHSVRFLNVERVKEDLRKLSEKNPRMVKFVDRTFNCNSKFAIEIWSFLIELNTDCTFHFEISADLLTEKEIKLLSSAPKGRFQFEVGVQTTNDQVLSNINRQVKYIDIKEKVLEVGKKGNIKQHLDLIAGLPGEGFHSFANSFNDVYSLLPEEIQLGFLKVLKGSPMEDEADKWNIIYSPYPPYEVLKTRDLNYEELRRIKRIEEIVDKYYNSGKFSNSIKYIVSPYDKPFDFYFEMCLYLEERNFFNCNLPSNEYYNVIVDFNEKYGKVDKSVLKELLRYDYLKLNKKRGLPEWLGKALQKEEELKIKNSLKALKSNLISKNLFFEMFNIDVLNYEIKNELKSNCIILGFDMENHNEVYNISHELKNC